MAFLEIIFGISYNHTIWSIEAYAYDPNEAKCSSPPHQISVLVEYVYKIKYTVDTTTQGEL